MVNREEKEFAELFYRALRDKGLGIPKTVEEVKAADEEGVEIDFKDLPTRLQDAAEVLRRRKAFTIKFKDLTSEEEPCKDHSAARAARFGGEITEEMEEKMRLDRMKSRSKSKK